MGTLSGRTILMVIASQQFRDEEYAVPRQLFEAAGALVTVASSTLKPATGMLGMTAQADLLLNDVDPKRFDAVVFVGGMGATEYWEDSTAHQIARRMTGDGKVAAAICLAPMTLANAGLLQGRRATMWPSEAKAFQAKGVVYTGRPVEQDGLFITGSGPEAAEPFGRAVVKALAAAPIRAS